MQERPGLTEWMASRRPAVPAAFRPWMEPAGAAAGARGEGELSAIVAEARAALARARRGEGRRRGAFMLLAADGFATWACEAALEAADPEAALRTVLEALVE